MRRRKRNQSAAQLANLRRTNAPPAPPDNRRAETHGGYARVADDRLKARQREIFEALAEDAPIRDPDDGGLHKADTARVRVLAQALERLDSVSAWVDRHGPLDVRGRPRPAAELERRLRREVGEHLDAMGMSPLARARLGVDIVRAAEGVARLEAPPDAVERSRRAAALLMDVGAFDEGVLALGKGHGNGGAAQAWPERVAAVIDRRTEEP